MLIQLLLGTAPTLILQSSVKLLEEPRMTNCPPWLHTCSDTLTESLEPYHNHACDTGLLQVAEATHPVPGKTAFPWQTVIQWLDRHDESVRDFTALTTRMSTVMGNSDSLFRLFSSCRDKKESVQTCHTEPHTAIRKENSAMHESLLERSKWQTAAILLQIKLLRSWTQGPTVKKLTSLCLRGPIWES